MPSKVLAGSMFSWLRISLTRLSGMKAVEADVPGHGNLEHVVDDQIPGEDDQRQHGGNGQHQGRVNALRQLCAGVAPVDTDVDEVVPLAAAFALVAVVAQDLHQVLLDVQGVFQHHIQIPGAGHAVQGVGGVDV